MYPTSAAYKTAIAQNVRDVKITGTITLKDASVINISDADVVQGSLYITEQCVSGEDIEIGNVYASEMGLALISPPANPYSLDGARILINFGIDVGGSYEYVPLGYFYVTEIDRKDTAVNLKALDGMILFDVDLTGVTTSGTPYQIISSCCSKVGVTLATDAATFSTFANAGISFNLPTDSKVETCRDLIMWVCQLTGTFARMTREGQLEIVPVTAGASVKTISKSERFMSDVSDFEVKVTKVTMKVGEDEYSQGADGMTMTLEENPLLADKEAADINTALSNILAQITVAEYVPYNVDFNGDPSLQAGDWVTIDEAGLLDTETGIYFLAATMPFEFIKNVVKTIITHHSWHYRGAHNIKGAGKSGLIRNVQGQQQKSVSSIEVIAKAAQEIAQAANQSTQLINDAIGGNILIRENGPTNEILIMDNADPELATKIWRWNMGGLGYSDNVTGANNPGRTYSVAMTMDGAINADFIKTGTLSAITVESISGTFSNLMAGTSGGSRLEMGDDAGTPYLNMYDSAELRVQLGQVDLRFWRGGTDIGGLRSEYINEYYRGAILGDVLYIEAAGNGIALNASADDSNASLVVYPTLTWVSALESGGSVQPEQGYDASFDLGNILDRWRNLYISDVILVGDSLTSNYLALEWNDIRFFGNGVSYIRQEGGISGRLFFTVNDGVNTHTILELNPVIDGAEMVVPIPNDSNVDIIFDDYGSYSGNTRPTIRPSDDTFGFVGTSSRRFYQMYASGGFLTSSEERLKTNISEVTKKGSYYDALKNLKFKTYQFKGEIENSKDGKSRTHLGVIADEAPDLITDEEKKNISLYPLISLIGTAVQAIQDRLETLEAKI